MVKTAAELKLEEFHLKSELQSLVKGIVDGDDFALEDTDRAIQALRALEELKLTSSEMGVSGDDDHLPLHFRCSISGKLMKDPVIIDSGLTYDQSAYKDWLVESNQQHLTYNILTPNLLVKEMILNWLKEKQVLLDLLARLSSSDIHDQKRAAKEIRHRSKSSEIMRCLFGKIPGAISRMIEALKFSWNNDLVVEADSITALYHISMPESNKKLLAEHSEAIPVIIRSLKSQLAQTRCNAASTLLSLSFLDPNKQTIAEYGALKPLIELVDEAHPLVRKNAAEAIFSLCILRENRSRIVADGALPVILQKIREEILVDELLSVLTLLCSQGDGVLEMIKADVVSLLIDIMGAEGSKQDNKDTALTAIWMICLVDSQQLKHVNRNELHQLTQHGTPRAQKVALSLLETLTAWEGLA